VTQPEPVAAAITEITGTIGFAVHDAEGNLISDDKDGE
jgi:hypothetical protein